MKMRKSADRSIGDGISTLSQDELEVVVGGNARDTVTDSFAEKEELACYETSFTIRGTTVRFCLELYH